MGMIIFAEKDRKGEFHAHALLSSRTYLKQSFMWPAAFAKARLALYAEVRVMNINLALYAEVRVMNINLCGSSSNELYAFPYNSESSLRAVGILALLSIRCASVRQHEGAC